MFNLSSTIRQRLALGWVNLHAFHIDPDPPDSANTNTADTAKLPAANQRILHLWRYLGCQISGTSERLRKTTFVTASRHVRMLHEQGPYYTTRVAISRHTLVLVPPNSNPLCTTWRPLDRQSFRTHRRQEPGLLPIAMCRFCKIRPPTINPIPLRRGLSG